MLVREHACARQGSGHDDRRRIPRLGRGGRPFLAARGLRAERDGAGEPNPRSDTDRIRSSSDRSSLCGVLATPGVVPRVLADQNVRIADLAELSGL